MNKKLIIVAGSLALAFVGYKVISKRKKNKWDENCRKNGGIVEKSGTTCNFNNCDKRKFPCNIYGL